MLSPLFWAFLGPQNFAFRIFLVSSLEFFSPLHSLPSRHIPGALHEGALFASTALSFCASFSAVLRAPPWRIFCMSRTTPFWMIFCVPLLDTSSNFIELILHVASINDPLFLGEERQILTFWPPSASGFQRKCPLVFHTLREYVVPCHTVAHAQKNSLVNFGSWSPCLGLAVSMFGASLHPFCLPASPTCDFFYFFLWNTKMFLFFTFGCILQIFTTLPCPDKSSFFQFSEHTLWHVGPHHGNPKKLKKL